jgi:hypothetical protein
MVLSLKQIVFSGFPQNLSLKNLGFQTGVPPDLEPEKPA